MKAKSIRGNSVPEIGLALEQSLSDGYQPTLAVVFASIQHDLDGIASLLDQRQIRVFGASSSGEFIDGDISQGGIAILLLDTDPACFRILLEDYRDKDPQEVARAMTAAAKEQFHQPCFIISASVNATDPSELLLGDALLKSIESVAGSDAVIWGGRAGDDLAFRETVVFTNNRSTKRGIIMLVLDGEKIFISGVAESGLRPVGTEKVITKATGNWVYEIDGQPAAEMVLKYLGLHLTQEEAETFFPKEGIMFSVSREAGEPVIRGVGVFNWKDKSFSTLGNIRQGDKIRLTLPPDFEVVEEVNLRAEKIRREKIPAADALLMFSCVGRLGQFGPLISDEIDGVRNVFNVPMAGFFSYGEFGRAQNGNNEFHASTCCWVALKEK